MGGPDVFTHVQLVRVVRDLGNEDSDIVVNCLDLEATYRLLVESRFLGFNLRVAWIADQNLTGFVNTTLRWRDGDLRSFQRQFWVMHGTVPSDMALRCATAAHTTATMEASNSRRSVKPDHIAFQLSNFDGMTTCYGMFSQQFARDVGGSGHAVGHP